MRVRPRISSCMYGYFAIDNNGNAICSRDAVDYITRHKKFYHDVSTWTGLIDIQGGVNHIAGLKADGSVVITQAHDHGLLGAPNTVTSSPFVKMSQGASSYDDTYLIREDGTCTYLTGMTQGTMVESWRNIVEIVGSYHKPTGLTADGKLVGAHTNLPSSGIKIVQLAGFSNGVIALTDTGDVYSISNGEYCKILSDITLIGCGHHLPSAYNKNTNTIYWCNRDKATAFEKKPDITTHGPVIMISSSIGGDTTNPRILYADGYTAGLQGTDPWELGRYITDGLCVSSTPINLLSKSKVNGFTFRGIEPEHTTRKLAFKVDNTWNKLNVSGAGIATLSPLSTQNITAESVKAEGNTVSELVSVQSIPAFAGKLVYPAIALHANIEAENMPTFGMTVKAEIDTTVNTYSRTEYSQEYALSSEDIQIISVVAETETTGQGAVTVTARLKQGQTWTDYMPLNDVQMKNANALQLKAVYTVQTTDGTDSAKIKSVAVKHNTAGGIVSGVKTDIVTMTQRFTNNLIYAHAYIKHEKLRDAVINAYCALRKTQKRRELYQIGNGTGALHTYQLPDSGVNQNTLQLYINGKAADNFDYNTETSQITVSAESDAVLSASYEYGWEPETWAKMTRGASQVNDSGMYTTEYTYTIPQKAEPHSVTAIRYELDRPTGTVTNEILGAATGQRQIFQLPHYAKKETIQCTGAWSYDYDSRQLKVIQTTGANVVISYDWIAESPKVYGIAAGWVD